MNEEQIKARIEALSRNSHYGKFGSVDLRVDSSRWTGIHPLGRSRRAELRWTWFRFRMCNGAGHWLAHAATMRQIEADLSRDGPGGCCCLECSLAKGYDA